MSFHSPNISNKGCWNSEECVQHNLWLTLNEEVSHLLCHVPQIVCNISCDVYLLQQPSNSNRIIIKRGSLFIERHPRKPIIHRCHCRLRGLEANLYGTWSYMMSTNLFKYLYMTHDAHLKFCSPLQCWKLCSCNQEGCWLTKEEGCSACHQM